MLACVRGWFDPEMVWTPPPSGKRSRQQQFSDAAIQTCLTTARQGTRSGVPRRAEGPVWHAVSTNNWVYPEPFEIGRTGLGGAGFQHHISSTARQAVAKQSAEGARRHYT